jgi:hypothetical protein
LAIAGGPTKVRLHYTASADVPAAVFGLGFIHESGVFVSGPNSSDLGPWTVPTGQGVVEFQMDPLLLQPGTYSVTTAVVDRGHTYDYCERQFVLKVRGRGTEEPGLTRQPGRWIPPHPDSRPSTVTAGDTHADE